MFKKHFIHTCKMHMSKCEHSQITTKVRKTKKNRQREQKTPQNENFQDNIMVGIRALMDLKI